MSNPGTGRTNYAMVERKVGDLWVDPAVQRSLKKQRVNNMANNFSPDALGVITTSWRAANRIHIIDGQHRYRAAEAAGYTGIIQTLEYKGLSIPEEAALFRELNTTEKVSRIDQFLVRCVEQDPDAVRLAKFIAAHGLSVATGATSGRISAIASLERVYALSPTAADATLAVLTTAFGATPAAMQGSLIEGLGRMLARYQGEYDIDLTDLAQRMSKVPGGANGLVGNARGQAFTRTGNLSTQVARVITSLYNQRRRSTAVPEWT